jgi:hypothetical protein
MLFPSFVTAVDDWSPHRRVTALAVSLANFDTTWYPRACSKLGTARAAAARTTVNSDLCGELVFVDQAAKPVAATEPVQREELTLGWFAGRWMLGEGGRWPSDRCGRCSL